MPASCFAASIQQLMPALRTQVLIPTSQFVRSLVAARLAADVSGVPTVLIARTDAHSANLLTADVDERDQPFIHGERTPEGFHQFKGGIKVRMRIILLCPMFYDTMAAHDADLDNPCLCICLTAMHLSGHTICHATKTHRRQGERFWA